MCTPDAAAEKARLRREMLCIRREIPREAREEASRCIEAGLREWLLRQPVRRVFCYVSYDVKSYLREYVHIFVSFFYFLFIKNFRKCMQCIGCVMADFFVRLFFCHSNNTICYR